MICFSFVRRQKIASYKLCNRFCIHSIKSNSWLLVTASIERSSKPLLIGLFSVFSDADKKPVLNRARYKPLRLNTVVKSGNSFDRAVTRYEGQSKTE